jgi:two-component system nitrate/nitrite response regulator NarL
MNRQLAISIIARNEIDCHGLEHILLGGRFVVEHRITDSKQLDFAGWRDDPEHIVIVDGSTEQSSLERCAALRAALPNARIVLMCDDCGLETIREAFAIAVDGVLAKDIGSKPLISAIALIGLGEKVIPSQFIDVLTAASGATSTRAWGSRASLAQLSERELGILRQLVAGDANKLIARKLDVAEATVKAHIKAILRKLQVENRTQAAIWAISHGLDQYDPKAAKPPGRASRHDHRDHRDHMDRRDADGGWE